MLISSKSNQPLLTPKKILTEPLPTHVFPGNTTTLHSKMSPSKPQPSPIGTPTTPSSSVTQFGGAFPPGQSIFGNIVYDESERNPFTGYFQYILIDGQQRITSTMLFLTAIRDEEDDALKNSIDVTYLKNQDAPEERKLAIL